MISECIQTILFCMVFNSKLMNMMTHLVDFTLIFHDGQDSLYLQAFNIF